MYLSPAYVGQIDEIILEAETVSVAGVKYAKQADYINGLPEHSLRLREHIKVGDSQFVKLRPQGGNDQVQELEFVNFRPGSVIAFKYV